MNKIFIRALATSIIGVLFVSVLTIASEPSLSSAATASDTVVITLNVTTGISITSPADAAMSANLGVAQNSAIATTTWNVKTNNVLGYTLAVRATSTPAMQQSATVNIADYQTGTPNTWVATSGQAYFGYSGFGTDVPTGTWGTGTVCNGGSDPNATSTTLKYKGFTTSDVTIATRAATTTTSGVDSTVCYAVEQKNFYVPSGAYNATIIATATTL